MLCFFSPSVYISQTLGKNFQEALKRGIMEGLNKNGVNTPEFLRLTPPPAPIQSLVDEWDKMKPLPEFPISHKHTKIFVSGKSNGFICCDSHFGECPFIPNALINVKKEGEENG